MDEKHLASVEKWTLTFAALAVALSAILFTRRFTFGVTVGAALMSLNAVALRRIGERAFRTFKKPGAAVLLFNLKMFALIALVFVILRYLPVDPIGFVVGISIFPVAIVATAIRHQLHGQTPDEKKGETHG